MFLAHNVRLFLPRLGPPPLSLAIVIIQAPGQV